MKIMKQPTLSNGTIPMPATGIDEQCTPEMVMAQLQKMLQSPIFARSRRLRKFLRFTVTQTLANQQERLKEYSIGLEVFDKPESFDPRMDSIVRVVARRLRAMVETYYATDGRDDDVVIQFTSGSYVPSWTRRNRTRAQDGNGLHTFIVLDANSSGAEALHDGLSPQRVAESIAQKLGVPIMHVPPETKQEMVRQLLAEDSDVFVARAATEVV
jgi:hypothetical protein